MSPANKGHGDIVGDGLTTVASEFGDAVAFNSRAQFASATGSGVSGQTQYVARRGASGWSTLAVTPMPRQDALQTFFAATKLQVFSNDLRTALLWAYDLPAVSGDATDRNNMYIEDTATRALEPITVSQQDPLSPFDFLNEQVWGISGDARHVAFSSGTSLLPEAVGGAPYVYQWDEGVLTLAGVLPDGSVPSGGTAVFPPTSSQINYRDAMSADGSRLAFTSPAFDAFTTQLYLRIDGSRTVWVSQPEGADQSTPANVMLQGMTRDGQNVFFVTDSALLDSDSNGGADLYRYTHSADPDTDRNLTMISQDGDTPGDLQGASLVGFSEDGERVYFQTAGARLVLWDHGRTHVIHRDLGRHPTPTFQLTVTASEPGHGRVTPDGEFMAFLTDQDGPTGEVTNGHFEVYVYSLEDDTLRCVSCPAGPATTDAGVMPKVTAGNPTIDNVGFRPRFLSDDGQVFFSTAEALDPEDRNGLEDVYEYDSATGELSLLSTGKGRYPTMFADASASGDDVFVVTRQPLVSTDDDELVDLYDVRVGAAPPEPEIHEKVPCTGEACQPPPSPRPEEDMLGSVLFDEDVAGSLVPRKALVVRRRATLHRAAGSLRVRLRVPGTLEWRGRGLRSGSVKRGRAGRARVVLRLKRRSRAHLRAKGVYRTKVRMKLVRSGGDEVMAVTRVTFRTTAKKGR